jgi:hypothetical protein
MVVLTLSLAWPTVFGKYIGDIFEAIALAFCEVDFHLLELLLEELNWDYLLLIMEVFQEICQASKLAVLIVASKGLDFVEVLGLEDSSE